VNMRALLPALLVLCPFQAAAQYAGPAVQSCRAYAQAELKMTGTGAATVRFDNDRHLNIERYTRKAGSQFVSSLLFGHGAIMLVKGPPIEMSFLCLLASDRQPLFFFWSPRPEAPVLAQCRRGAAEKPASKPEDCLDPLLQAAEFDLTQLYAKHFQRAHEEDQKSGGSARVDAFRRSSDAFRAYRDAECARRGPAGGEAQRACLVELSRRRGFDLQ